MWFRCCYWCIFVSAETLRIPNMSVFREHYAHAKCSHFCVTLVVFLVVVVGVFLLLLFAWFAADDLFSCLLEEFAAEDCFQKAGAAGADRNRYTNIWDWADSERRFFASGFCSSAEQFNDLSSLHFNSTNPLRALVYTHFLQLNHTSSHTYFKYPTSNVLVISLCIYI